MDSINWSQEQMLEVGLKEPDDFLKYEKPILALVLLQEKKESYISTVISYINREDITSCILKNYLHLMEKKPTYLRTILQDVIRLRIC